MVRKRNRERNRELRAIPRYFFSQPSSTVMVEALIFAFAQSVLSSPHSAAPPPAQLAPS
jgi:hypothetical protein